VLKQLLEDARAMLRQLEQRIRACKDCPLYLTATQAVPGEGLPNAEVMFVGEGPGRQEDREGRPFVGAAGRIFDSML
jgi:DNA polymerase